MLRPLISLLLATALLAAACGSDAEPSGAAGGATPQIAESTAEPEPTTAPATDEPAAATPIPAEPETDPTVASEAPTAEPTEAPAEPTATPTVAPLATAPVPDRLALELVSVLQIPDPISLATRAGSDNLFLALKSGSVVEIGLDQTGAGTIVRELIDVGAEVSDGNEQGLLGLAFSPSGDNVFVNFTDRDDTTNVVGWDMAGDEIDPASRRTLLTIEQPFRNHNGGHMAFGPDGNLFIAVGDGGGAGDPRGHGQNPETLLGTLLRISPTGDSYEIPADNPFVNGGGRLEIFAWGLRNPWRFSFDRATGDLWIGDVGQEELEEIDVLYAAEGGGNGANLGWADVEGTAPFNAGAPPRADYVAPIHQYTHDDGCSVTGGYVYRGQQIPELAGHYVFADFCSGGVWGLASTPAGDLTGVFDIDFGIYTGQLASFGEGPDGELYAMLFDRGLMRVTSAG